MLEAAAWGLIAASSLVIGSWLTFWLKPSRKLIGLIMAFGAGTLISAIAYDLVEDAADSGRALALTAGLALGAITFFIGDWWVDRAGGEHRKRSGGEQAQGNSFGIFIGTLLDGIPESFILGASLVASSGVSAAFLVAVFVSNLPEAMGATTGMITAGWPKPRILSIWLAVAGVSAVAAAIGYAFTAAMSLDGVLAQAFAAGALLTMLADSMIPEAFENGGKAVGLLTVLGFAVAFALSQLA
ncbi:MAG TPA: ZIP family zinc transporter [Anaerolineae bacterium]|nr:ZIP family zinc transporter [Anaerolineae bacterium]